MTRNDAFRYEKGDERNRRGANAGTNQQIFSSSQECAAIKKGVPIPPGMPPMHVRQRGRPAVRVVQQPKTNVVLPAIDDGHQWKKNIVKRAGYHGCKNVAASQPGEKNCGNRFEAHDWDEAKENADGNSPSYGFGSVPNRQQF